MSEKGVSPGADDPSAQELPDAVLARLAAPIVWKVRLRDSDGYPYEWSGGTGSDADTYLLQLQADGLCMLTVPGRTYAPVWGLRKTREFAQIEKGRQVAALLAPELLERFREHVDLRGRYGSRMSDDEVEEARRLAGIQARRRLREFDDLAAGWDGSSAAAPFRSAVDQADLFVRVVLTAGVDVDLDPVLDVDGSVILELDGGSLKFKGDGRIVYAFDDGDRGTVVFDGLRIPDVVQNPLVASSELRQDRT